MFTTCPACDRQYRIKASQLTAAQGQVRCGYCGEQFSALEHLSDKPLSRPQQALEELRQATGEIPPPEMIEESLSMEIVEVQGKGNFVEPEFDIPGILQEEEKPPMSRTAKFFWSTGILLLVLAIVIQVAWFNRDRLLDKYPEMKPWAQKICDQLQCELIRHYSATSIKLLNRDVRLHPHYSDTLLVNASMANRSVNVQPYPKIQFSLFDTAGKMIASRIFSPNEYLDNSIDIKNGMPSNQPVHFVLEVTGPMDSAVSFEFAFL